MKHPWLAYAIVALLAVGAGVAVAGLPNNEPAVATIITPTTVDTFTTSVPETTDATSEAPGTTVTDTTDPDTTDTTDPDTTDPDTTDPDTTDPTDPDTTDPTDPDTTDPDTTEVPARGEIAVIVANGSGLNGAAAVNVARLELVGYVDVESRNGTDVVDFTVVYYAAGFDEAALRMADDLDLLPEFVAPLADAPTVIDLPLGVELLAYIGVDRAR